jgi:6,7-dimethyl-8-ribityllumazine synthase
MSTALPPKPRIFAPSQTIYIVVSTYNQKLVDSLVDNCLEELEEIMPQVKVNIVRVPGSFEIPVTIEKIAASQDKPSLFIALGLIIRGATAHADLVAAAVTTELSSLAVRHQTPVIHEVLLVDDEKQAYARCVANKLNRGREAARAAANRAEIFHKLTATLSR